MATKNSSIDQHWKACGKCGIENPEEMVRCVKCQAPLPSRGNKALSWMVQADIPANPSPSEIDFDGDGRTYVVVFLIKMKPEWYHLGRTDRVEINKRHMGVLTNYAKLVHRTMLRTEGLSKYDYVETIEADDLKIVNSLMRTIKDSEKGKYLDFVEAIVTVKGLSLYSVEAADCVPSQK